MLTARAVSSARSTSSTPTSRSFTATMPVELKLRMWLPAMPTKAALILQSAISSASSSALCPAATVAWMLTTTPFFSPLDSCEPMPRISSAPSGPSSETKHATFEVPMSSATTRFLFSFGMLGLRPAFHAQRKTVRIAQVHHLRHGPPGRTCISPDEALQPLLREVGIASERELQAVRQPQAPCVAGPPPPPPDRAFPRPAPTRPP